MENLLAFCIPTYNRASILEMVIVKLLDLCEKYNIAIYISDNSSPDNTEAVVQKYTSQYKFIYYYRHPQNIGPDNNFEYVLKMPDTKYRWLMSDTCYVDEIDTVISDLVSQEWDGYILSGMSTHARLPQQKTLYTDTISLMKEISSHLSWISCMIYNEKLVESMNFERYKASSFNQTALMFETTANRKCLICYNPDIIVKAVPILKESGWHYHVFDIFYRQWFLLVMSLPLYYPFEAKMKCITDMAKDTVLTIHSHANRRGEGKWIINDVYRNRFFIKQSGGDYYTLILLGLCPQILLKFVFSLGHYVKGYMKNLGIKI